MRISDDTLGKLSSTEALISLKLSTALKYAWQKDTAYPDDVGRWRVDNPSVGQCTVTSLVVQDYLDGEIHKNSAYNHYWNEVRNKGFIDFTYDQFNTDADIPSERIRPRDELLEGEGGKRNNTKHRYQLLKDRVKNQMEKIRPTLFLLSSNAQLEYIHDIVEAISLPEGAIHHFRYQLRFIDPLLRKILPTTEQELPSDLKNAKVVIVYLNQKKTEGGSYLWNETLAVRVAVLKKCYKTGEAEKSTAHFYFEVGKNLLQKDKDDNQIRKIFGEHYGKGNSYCLLTYEDSNLLADEYAGGKIFEQQCDMMKKVGLDYDDAGRITHYEPPLMVFVEGIYKKRALGANKILKPIYDSFAPKSVYRLREGASYYFRFRIYSWDEKKRYKVRLTVPNEAFCTPSEYILPVNSSYDSECWQLIPAFIEQSSSGYMTLEVEAVNMPASKEQFVHELDWKLTAMFEIKRKASLRILDTLADLLFALGPLYIASTKLFESTAPKSILNVYWGPILVLLYGLWFIVKLIRRIIGGA